MVRLLVRRAGEMFASLVGLADEVPLRTWSAFEAATLKALGVDARTHTVADAKLCINGTPLGDIKREHDGDLAHLKEDDIIDVVVLSTSTPAAAEALAATARAAAPASTLTERARKPEATAPAAPPRPTTTTIVEPPAPAAPPPPPRPRAPDANTPLAPARDAPSVGLQTPLSSGGNRPQGGRRRPPQAHPHLRCPRCQSDDTRYEYHRRSDKSPVYSCKGCTRRWSALSKKWSAALPHGAAMPAMPSKPATPAALPMAAPAAALAAAPTAALAAAPAAVPAAAPAASPTADAPQRATRSPSPAAAEGTPPVKRQKTPSPLPQDDEAKDLSDVPVDESDDESDEDADPSWQEGDDD